MHYTGYDLYSQLTIRLLHSKASVTHKTNNGY